MTTFADLAQSMTDNAIYVGLFGFTIATANKHLGLPPSATEAQRRDELGTLALQALASVERVLAVTLERNGASTLEQTISTAKYLAGDMSAYYRERGVNGVMLLTADDVMTARSKR